MFDVKYLSAVEIKDGGTLPFLLVTTEDNKRYQVKIPNLYSSAMLKEYIAYNIANSINLSTPSASFIYFNTTQISYALDQMQAYSSSYEAKFYSSLEMLKNKDGDIILFGIEWVEETEIVLEPLSYYFDRCISDNLYATFSFDLLLHNSDRHIKNILVCSQGRNEYVIYLIDHDRIFNTYASIEDLQDIKNSFDCLYSSNTKYLFEYIDSSLKKEKILDIALKYNNILGEDIQNFLDIYSDFCPLDELNDCETKTILKDFIVYRISNIVDACKNNFEKVECYGSIR